METENILTAVVSLIFVIGLIGLIAVLARRFGLGFPVRATQIGKNRRLKIVEVTPLDGKRRLVLIRRDGVEHLILISPNSELVVETGITSDTLLKSGTPDIKNDLINNHFSKESELL